MSFSYVRISYPFDASSESPHQSVCHDACHACTCEWCCCNKPVSDDVPGCHETMLANKDDKAQKKAGEAKFKAPTTKTVTSFEFCVHETSAKKFRQVPDAANGMNEGIC